ncbi:hypothetical protein JXA84_04580 [candidate division WOR-3 bacterium]|nr:hypothetical protein [candidate division WOR-3 bacterium]
MTKNLPHQEIGHDDIFVKYVKKGVLLIKKYPYHTILAIVASVSVIILLSTLLGRKSENLTKSDQVLQTMNLFDALYFQENTQEILTGIMQSMEGLSKSANQDTSGKALINTLEGYAMMLQFQYQLAAEKWQKVYSGEEPSPKIVNLVATLGFSDLVDPVNSLSILYPKLQEFFVEDSGLAMLAILDAGENAALTLMYDTSLAVDTSANQIYEMGRTALEYSSLNMTNAFLKNEADFYGDILEVAYQVRKNKIEVNE